MPSVKKLQLSFSGGEVTPEFFGRADDSKYQSGLASCRNFIVKPQGPVENRAGFGFVREVKDSAKRTRLIAFTYSTTQTMVIELGAGYFRFHTQGATLLAGSPAAYDAGHAYVIGDLVSDAGANYYCTAPTTGNAPPDVSYWYLLPASGEYEAPNPFAEADLFDIHYVQSADVLTLVHPNYPPCELRRLGATQWVLQDISFTPGIAAPAAPTVTAAGSSGAAINHYYVVTAMDADNVRESPASTAGSVSSNLFQTGCTNTIAWATVTGASRYNVYKQQGGLYGYIGQTDGLSIVDDNISPDMSKTPPIYETVFDGPGKYPAAVSYFEQRRCFAGTTNKPQNLWMTKSATESDMSYSLPVKADDRIAFRVAAREANTVRHIVPLSQLLVLTSSAEWAIVPINSDAITPDTTSVRPQSYVGASNVQPVIVNNTLLYSAARGGHARELAYNWQASGFVTGDLSLRAPHLFDTYRIVDMAYAKAPIPLVWMVSTSGDLLGLTYVPEQQVGAWHRHDTDGAFESCAVVAENEEDVLYCIIRRSVNGQEVRYVERMASRYITSPDNAFFVDSGMTYAGAPAKTISGLDHLEGKEVSILADGGVHPRQVVTDGSIHLEHEASVVQVGLPITAELATLPIAMQIDSAFGQGRPKNINQVWLRVFQSSGIFVGPSLDRLTEAKQRTDEPYGSAPALKTEEIAIRTTPSWSDGGQVYVRQSDPLPLTVVALTVEVALGG
ncbi:MAG TPA: hypothetical protein VF285_03075 [Castellaniella sp.]|uniref:hypothetical protein n=1 Tax=Castellaniella sp. TaxID=1955812 RepID=UPI002F23ED40